jgi:hypothetical protein
MTGLRIWWRLHRAPIAILVVASIVCGLFGIAYAENIRCDASLSATDCSQFLIYNPPSSIFTLALAVLPILLGVVLGISTVGSELESGTAAFAWSIVGSRRRWLAEQAVASCVSILVLGMLCGGFNALIVAKLNPGHNLPTSFVGYGLWGPILVVRGLSAYGISLAIGAMLRRVTASVALGLVLVTAATIAALVVGRSFETSQVLASNDPGIYDALGVGSGIPGPNGTFQTWDDCVLTEPLGLDGDARNAWPLEHCREVSSYLPGSKMVDVELRESAVLALLGLLGFGAALALVGSRRP